MSAPERGTHIAVTTPDDRKRVNLKRYIHPAFEQWRIYREDGGKRIILEAVEEPS